MKEIVNQIMESGYRAKIMPGVWFPVRSTIVFLSSGNALVISPGPETAKILSQSEKSFSKIFVVSPNAMHYAHVEGFCNAFPDAEFFCPKATLKKIPKLASKAKPIENLEDLISTDIDIIRINGNSFLSETVFYHKMSSSLITTDLCFNMKGKMNFATRSLLKMVGAYAKIGQSMLVKLSTRDKKAYLESVAKLKNLPLARVIVGHGDIINKDKLNEFWSALGLDK